MRLIISFCLVSTIAMAGFSAVCGDSKTPKLTDLVRAPLGPERYVYLTEGIAMEAASPRREPDGRVSLKAVTVKSPEILVDGFPFSNTIPTKSMISTEIADCYKRTLQIKDLISVTDKGYTDNLPSAGVVLSAEPHTVGSAVVRYLCDADYRKGIITKRRTFDREAVITEILKEQVRGEAH